MLSPTLLTSENDVALFVQDEPCAVGMGGNA
jgi:hypothetical protein